jgi:hypothetical protein
MQDEPETTTESEAGGSEMRHAQQWLNDHERPSFDYLMGIAKRHTAQAAEIIMVLAEKYNIQYDRSMPLEEAVHRIWTAMESSPDQSV